MADEEQGFTFVDKRRTAVETPAEEPVSVDSVSLETEAPSAEELQPETQVQEKTDIYNVLGYCVSILASEAWQKLGLIADQQTGEATQDLAQAKVAIDAASDLGARLESAPEASVPDSLKRDLRNLLQDLRLNYVTQQGQST